MNIIATDKDAWDGVSVKNAGCYFPWEHKNFDGMMNAAGLVDSYRILHPDDSDFSYFYQNKPEYRLNNQGFRIDYFGCFADERRTNIRCPGYKSELDYKERCVKQM